MLIWLRKPTHQQRDMAEGLYGAIVAQARQPFFYRDLAVPDTVDGRFDMILLHAFVVMLRLREGGEATRELSQTLYDVMFADMDRAVREIGIGDLSVKKHIRRMMKAFNGRMAAYEAALAEPDPAVLTESLRRNVYGTVKDPQAAAPESLKVLAMYLRETVDAARAMPVEMMTVGGQMPWAQDVKEAA